MCEFQVSRVFDVNSSLEKRLDIMVVFYDFVFPHDLQHQQRPKLFLVSVLYHIFGAYFSVALVCSRFCWLQSGMQQKFPISCLMQLLSNLPLIFFFVPYRLPGIDLTLSCNRPALSLDLFYPESVRCCMYSQFFCLGEFFTWKFFGPDSLKTICTSALNTHIYIIHLRRAG